MNCHHCGKWIDLEWVSKEEEQKFDAEMSASGIVAICTDCYIPEETEIEILKRTHDELRGDEENLVYRLRKRAEIRRQIPGRKSVQEGKQDRLADLLEEAANEIQFLKERLHR
jgi:hypothetical protein